MLSSEHGAASKETNSYLTVPAGGLNINKGLTLRGGVTAGGWNPSKIFDLEIKAEGEHLHAGAEVHNTCSLY
jgi:hypothetical protein